jgi:alkylhydroperoxidase family enzyme
MSDRYTEHVTRLRKAVLEGSGETAPSLRQAVEARAAGLGGQPDLGASGPELPAVLARFVDTIARRAFEVSNEDVAALRQAGFSEDAIFEITASAALGAGLGRLERGIAALKGDL